MKTLNRRILSFVIIILSLFSLAFLGVFVHLSNNLVINTHKQEMLTLTENLTDRISGNFDSIEEIQQDLENNQDYLLMGSTLMDSEGQVLFDSEITDRLGEDLSDLPEVSMAIQNEDIGTAERENQFTEENGLYVASPIYLADGSLGGFLRVHEDADQYTHLLRSLSLALLVFLALGVLVTVITTLYWAKRINTPFEELNRVIGRLVNHDYSARYQANSYDEINEMGESINHLAMSLDNQYKENKQYSRRMRELVQYLTIGIIFIDEERKIRIVNPAANEILDTNLYSNIGNEYTEHIQSAELVRTIERSIKNKKNYNKEIILYLQNERIVDVNVVLIPGETIEMYNYAVLLYDITEIRRLEKIRTDFVANASHELRTPITALKGFSETLLDGAMHEPEVLQEFLQIMHKESARLDTMVKDILQLSKLEQKPASHIVTDINPTLVAEEVAQILQQKSEMKNIDITVTELDAIQIKVNQDEFKQVILNLVGNALAYTPEGGNVEIKIFTEANSHVIQVIDDGIGIPEEDQARIFERFYRVDKARSRNAGGTGLGLSIVKWLVEGMHGNIQLESTPKVGSTFSVYLPIDEN